MKKRVELLIHNGKTIVCADYSHLRGDEFVEIIGEQERESLALPEEKILHLMNFTNCRMNEQARERADKMMNTLANKGHTVKTACFGIRGIQQIIAGVVKGDIYFAKNIKEAKDWLTK